MKTLILLFSFILVLLSCEKTINEPDNETNDEPISDVNDVPSTDERCFTEESITSSETGFIILDPGLQLEGKASGIKINEEWTASSFFSKVDDRFGITLITYWTWEDDENLYTGEFLTIGPIDKNIKPNCYNLTSGPSTEDTIKTRYSIKDDDITVVEYELDNSTENILEIIEYNYEEKKFIGKFKASYITDEAIAPDAPEMARFFNVDIEIGN